uniref:glycosyltransferase 87 family protein n=1 Tax=Roseomonas rosulenta TaxID=2748667 RepID=UPI0018E01AA4
PALAGVALATLAFKPQLGLLVIPALVAARRWRVLSVATAAGLAWAVAAWLAFGADAWLAFFERLSDAGAAMAGGSVAIWKLQSVQAMAGSLGAGPRLAQGLQLAVTAGVLVVLVVVLRGRPGGLAEVALLAAATPLAAPFVLSYDMVLLLLPMAWVIRQARQGGFLPWEKAGLVAAYLLPGVSIAVGLAGGIGIGPVAPAIMLVLVLRRLRAPGGATA